jgi:hypothetical protein
VGIMYCFHPRCLKPFAFQFLVLAISLTSATTLAQPLPAAPIGLWAFRSTSAGPLQCSPGTLWFEAVAVGESKTEPAYLTNTGPTTITVLTMTQSALGFGVSGLNLPLTLSPGQKLLLTVSFNPQVIGHVDGIFVFTSDASSVTLPLYVHGRGVVAATVSVSPTSVNFGSVQVGRSGTQSETLTNSSGSSLTVSQVNVIGAGFSTAGLGVPLTLAPGQSVTVSVGFTPQVGGSSSGRLSVISNGLNPTVAVSLSGTGFTPGVLSANPSSASFGSVQVGNSSNQFATLTNTGFVSVTVSQANVSGAGFSLSGLGLPLTLTAGQSYTFGTIFSPSSAGSVSGSISVVSDATNSTLPISLSGNGTAAGMFGVNPTSLNFGSVGVGQSKSMPVMLSATGSAVTISSAAMSNTEFTLSGLSFPLTIAAGQSTPVTMTFTPQSSGAASANASYVSNASNSTALEALTGTGAAPQHSVDLSWSASASTAGYNLYRGNNRGGPYSKISAALNSSSYVDSSVQPGQAYYYVATTVDASGRESAYSNEAPAVIPSP